MSEHFSNQMLSIEKVGGANDGFKARMVETSKGWVWELNTHPGHFKQVFVPLDFEHPQMVEVK